MTKDSHKIQKLVMIDDNEADHILTKHMIDETGLVGEVVSFLSAQDALDYFVTEPADIDLVLLDVNMPIMDGFEFLEQAQEHLGEKFSYPVIVMLTTSLDPKDVDRAAKFSVVKDYCGKPLEEVDLQKYASMIEDMKRQT